MRFAIILASVFLVASCASNVPDAHHNKAANTAANTNTASVDHNSMGHGNHSSMRSSPGAASAPLELQFIDSMIVHHQGALEMAALATPRAQDPELKKLADSIIYDQETEIAKMSKLRDKWFGEKPEAINMDFPGMSTGMSGMDLAKLGTLKGRDFDIEFVRQMIPHHEGAVEMARSLKGNDSYAELKELCEDIIKAQEAEINQMRTWLAIWETQK